jgi:hypothetical protein
MLDTVVVELKLSQSDLSPSSHWSHHTNFAWLQSVEYYSLYCICKHFNFYIKLVTQTFLIYYNSYMCYTIMLQTWPFVLFGVIPIKNSPDRKSDSRRSNRSWKDSNIIFELSIESNSTLQNQLVGWGLSPLYKHIFRSSRNWYETS